MFLGRWKTICRPEVTFEGQALESKRSYPLTRWTWKRAKALNGGTNKAVARAELALRATFRPSILEATLAGGFLL